MKILQIGKFYPIRGGVEKVMYDLTTGLSSQGVECDMLCADHEGRGRTIEVGSKGRILSCRTWLKLAATMLSPSMVSTAMRICRRYDIVHIHHPDPMACLALFCARYKGKVILHWHSDIV
jgi:rhamnosyl/mannosyltransferase